MERKRRSKGDWGGGGESVDERGGWWDGVCWDDGDYGLG